MSLKGCFAFRQRRLASQDLSSPLLMKKVKRNIKSDDDAYSTDVNILVFNDNHLPIEKNFTPVHSEQEDYINIHCGDNHLILGISEEIYDSYKYKLASVKDIQSLFITCHSLLSILNGCNIENISWKELSRKQVNKDLLREHVIINTTPFDYNEDNHSVKLFLLDKINTFSRGNLASLAIMRDLLTYFSRTENSGDAFSIIRDLLPSSILLTTVIISCNPIVVRITSTGHITLDTITIMRVTPNYPSSILSFISKPLFKQPLQDNNLNVSFIIVCLVRTSVFYLTGDLQSVDIKRQIFLKAMTNRRFQQQQQNLHQLFHLPLYHIPKSVDKKPIFYDIQCNKQDLHLTVSFEYDIDNNEILVISEVEKRHLIHPNIKPGHILVSIGGISLQGVAHTKAVQIIRNTKRPCILRVYYFQ